MQLSIHFRTGWPSAAIYLHAGCPSAANYPSAAICPSAYWTPICMLDTRLQVEYCFWWQVLILELAAGDGEVFWGLRER
jgi:hypothetical protein